LAELREISLDEKAVAKRHRYAALVYAARRRGPPENKPGRLLDDADATTQGIDQGHDDGHVGPIHRLGSAVIVFEGFRIHSMFSKAVD
jgi:hypothetical protein